MELPAQAADIATLGAELERNGIDGSTASGVQVRRGNVIDRRTRLWLLKFPKPLAGYGLP